VRARYTIGPTIEKFAKVIWPGIQQIRHELRLGLSVLSYDRNLLTILSIAFEFP